MLKLSCDSNEGDQSTVEESEKQSRVMARASRRLRTERRLVVASFGILHVEFNMHSFFELGFEIGKTAEREGSRAASPALACVFLIPSRNPRLSHYCIVSVHSRVHHPRRRIRSSFPSLSFARMRIVTRGSSSRPSSVSVAKFSQATS